MAEEKKGGTIYQQLNSFLNLGSMDVQTAQPTVSASTPPKESKIIIKGNTPEEIHKKGLELEQKRELQNKFFRTTDRGFQKALQYDSDESDHKERAYQATLQAYLGGDLARRDRV